MIEKEKKAVKKKSAAPAEPKKRAPRAKKAEKAVQAPVHAPAHKEVEARPIVEAKHYTKKEPRPRMFPESVKVSHGTGRRKTSMASVYMGKGSGKITVNSKPYSEYFCNRPVLLSLIVRPLKEVKQEGVFDIHAHVKGGGVPSQADAVRLGIARALVAMNNEFRGVLRSLDLLKRDPREKERKKYGLKRASRAFQYTKR